MRLRFFLLFVLISAAAAVTAIHSTAKASTLNIVGGSNFNVLSTFSLTPQTGIATNQPLKVFDKTNGSVGGLYVSGHSLITFEYLGSEAGNTNQFLNGGGIFSNNSGSNPSFNVVSAGGTSLVPLTFATNGKYTVAGSVTNGLIGLLSPFSIAFTLLAPDKTSVYALFEDGHPDYDYDDLAVRISVTAVPLPPALFLFVSAIGFAACSAWRRLSFKN